MPVKKRGGYRAGAGRPRKALEERQPRHDGKLAAWLSVEDMALAQRLMPHFPDVPNIDALFAYALHQLAAHTDD